MPRVRVEVDRAKLRAIPDVSPELDNLLREKAHGISMKAQAVFRARQRMSNEWRLSETTPPKYIRSFKLERIQKARGHSWIVVNTDPSAAWIEYGAHAGGRTLVLRYYPLKTALFMQGIES